MTEGRSEAVKTLDCSVNCILGVCIHLYSAEGLEAKDWRVSEGGRYVLRVSKSKEEKDSSRLLEHSSLGRSNARDGGRFQNEETVEHLAVTARR
jgi:hypothetical protein